MFSDNFFLIWESNSDSTKMSYKISMPMFVSVSVQRRYCYLGYTALYLWCVFFLLPECFSIISLDFMLSFIFARCSNRIKIETTLINPTYCVQCLLASFALRIEFIYNFLLNIATFTNGNFNMEAFNKKGAPKRIADVIVYQNTLVNCSNCIISVINNI